VCSGTTSTLHSESQWLLDYVSVLGEVLNFEKSEVLGKTLSEGIPATGQNCSLLCQKIKAPQVYYHHHKIPSPEPHDFSQHLYKYPNSDFNIACHQSVTCDFLTNFPIKLLVYSPSPPEHCVSLTLHCSNITGDSYRSRSTSLSSFRHYFTLYRQFFHGHPNCMDLLTIRECVSCPYKVAGKITASLMCLHTC
jgi:hypothetical protein